MRRSISVSCVLTLILALVVALPGHARPVLLGEPVEPPAAGATLRPGAYSITLISGDRVRLDVPASGRPQVRVEPAVRPKGFVPQFHLSTRNDGLHLLPSDVGRLVPRLLDPALFNVTALVKQGFDDASRASIPLIVARSGTDARSGFPAAKESRPLSSVGAVAVEAAKPRVSELASALHRVVSATARTGKPAARLTAAEAGPLAGVSKVWLDGRVRVTLDRSTTQIGAPTAWKAGLDGAGVKVAVLDTGIDDSHQDLAGQVVAARNFTEEKDARDRHGHGTHVASTVAGTGNASGGDRRGVASGADLVNGKVLDGNGSGLISWIIAGMEWAAGEADADIVNMSLGADAASEAGQLMSRAVDTLTAAHDTLFVIAAGNDGCDGCVDSPGSAVSALTVGAVDREDALADFYSRGPVPGSQALKPDITAPGVGIWAARAEGAAAGGSGEYLQMSGTSMATPHVTGVAALLAQARPALGAAALKGALMSTAASANGLTAYQQGAGRVDVGRLIGSPVLAATGSVDFGYFPYPQQDLEPIRRSISYRNISDQAVTLTLRTEFDGPVSVRPSQLTVPVGGSVSAEVVLNVAESKPGRYSGKVVAEVPGGQRLQTPVAFIAQPEQHVLRVTGVARDGRPAVPTVTAVVNVADGTAVTLGRCADESVMAQCATLAEGTYSVVGTVATYPTWQAAPGDSNFTPPLHTALVGDPELVVDHDLTVTLDARRAVEVTVEVPRDKAVANLGGATQVVHTRIPERGRNFSDMLYNPPGGQLEERLFIQPMTIGRGDLATTHRWRLEAPDITMTVLGHGKRLDLEPRYYRADWFSDFSSQFPQLDRRTDMTVVDAGQGRPQDIDRAQLRGSLALIRRADGVPVAEQSNHAAAAGARMVAIYNDKPGVSADPGGLPEKALKVPTVRLSHAEGLALLDRVRQGHGRLKVRADGTPSSPYVYDLVYVERGNVPPRLHYLADRNQLVQVKRSFYSQDTESTSYTENSSAMFPWEFYTMSPDHPLQKVPLTRMDYHVYDPDAAWTYSVVAPEQPYNYLWPHPPNAFLRLNMPGVRYRPGEQAEQSWMRQPLAPGANAKYPLHRAGDKLVISPGLLSPPGLNAFGVVDGSGIFSSMSSTLDGQGIETRFLVRRGDEVLADTSHAPGGPDGFVTLPSGGPETYRVTFQVDNRSEWAKMSTRTRTDWTFRSERTPTPQTVPLLTLGYDLKVDLRNRLEVRRHRPAQVGITVGHLGVSDIPVTGLTFAASYDDGRSWRDVRVRRLADGRYMADLPGSPPKDARYVSFRVGATDATGGKIQQEIIRAAGLGG